MERKFPELRVYVNDDVDYVVVMCTQQRYIDWRNGKVLLNAYYDSSPDGKLEQTFVKPAKAWKFIASKYGEQYDDEPMNTSYKYDDDQLDTLARYGLFTYETMTDDENVHFVKKLKVDGNTVYAVGAFIEPDEDDGYWDD